VIFLFQILLILEEIDIVNFCFNMKIELKFGGRRDLISVLKLIGMN